MKIALLALLAALLGTAEAAPETRYAVILQDQVAGHLVRRDSGDGQVSVDFSYRDNGRGPDIAEAFALAPDGTVLRYRVEGKSTFGGEIRESFERTGGRARWSSVVDHGEQDAPAAAAYLPVDYSPAWFAELVRGLWRQPEHAAPALPGGRFVVERVDVLPVRSATGEAGRAGLYAVTGVDLTPAYVWLHEDTLGLLAMTEPSWALVQQGFEAEAPRLLARQEQAKGERLRALATRLAQPLPGLTVIRNVRWFDAPAARLRGPADVTLWNGRIGALLPPGSAPADAQQTIDGSGKTLLPGLFDMHGHVADADGLLHLAAGVTSVRDMGNVNSHLEALMARFDAGTELGPHVVPLGFIEGRSPFSANLGIVCATLDEARRAVDAYAARGYRQIKLYNSIKPEWVKPLAAYAHAKGLRVGGHVPAFMRAEQAVQAGYDELSHINQVMLNFFVRRDDDTRTLLRFTLVGDKAGDVDLDGPKVQAFLKLLKRRGTAVDATADTFEALLTQKSGERNPSLDAVADHLPASLRRAVLSNTMDVNDANAARYRRSYAQLLALIGRMHRAGIPLLAGTDDFAGFALHRELELYVKAGIPAPEVLRIATVNGARFTGTLHDTGTIERGKRADLMLVDGNPAERISDIRRVSLVIQGDMALAPDATYEALGIQPFVPAARIERRQPAPAQSGNS